MKVFSAIVLSIVLMGGMVGCGKTLVELRNDGDAIVDNAVNSGGGVLSTVGVIVKKVIGVGFAIYDLGKKMVEDTTDNVGTVTGGLVGTTPQK